MISNATPWMYEHALYNGVATQSLRFDDGSSHKLTRTFSGAVDNDKKMTISVWAKRGNLSGSSQVILANYNSVRFLGELKWNSNNGISFDPGGDGDGASNSYTVETSALFRDVSSWYHIVLAYDSTQGTDTNRVKLYVNGTQQTLTAKSGHTFPPLNYAHLYSYAGANNTIGEFGGGFNSGFLDGYLSEFNFVDGLTLDPTYFGETKNGVWIAKKYTGSYGTNGYRLQFKQTGVGTASTSTIGADTSGNTNHFTSSGIVASDCNMPDSPENNFCTWNTLSNTGVTLSEGNLQTSGGSSHVCGGTMAVTSGKWYWECKLKSTVNGSNPVILGFVSANTIAHANNFEQGVYFYTDNEGNKNIVHVENNSATQTITVPSAMLPIAVDEVMQYAYDGDTGKIWFGIENVWADNSGGTTGNPSTGANPTFTLADTNIFMTPLRDHGGVAWTGLANFGQLDNDYTAPTGFNSLSTSNLPEPTIGGISSTLPTDHFNTVLWSGTSSSNSITGVGFLPDLVWLKNRSAGWSNSLSDSSRGTGKSLYSDAADAEVTNDAYGYLSSFNSDGFTVVGGASGSNTVNVSGNTYVAWNWKANGGTATATISESGNNPAAVVQANPTAGFSIITYTGTSGTGSIAHGLGAVPKMIIIKNRGDARNWIVYHGENTSAPETDFLILNTTAATADNVVMFSDTAPTSSVFTIGNADNDGTNEDNDTFVAYVFAEVESYSRFGSYTGNGSTDGTFVYTGFRPAFLMYKRTDSTGNWLIDDNKTQTFNPDSNYLLADSADAEGDTTTNTAGHVFDMLSNGFKMRNTNSARNASGGTYIYMAFAEAPFKYANAR